VADSLDDGREDAKTRREKLKSTNCKGIWNGLARWSIAVLRTFSNLASDTRIANKQRCFRSSRLPVFRPALLAFSLTRHFSSRLRVFAPII